MKINTLAGNCGKFGTLFCLYSFLLPEIINSASSFVTNAAAIMNTLMAQQNEKSLHYKRNEIISILVQKIKDKI